MKLKDLKERFKPIQLTVEQWDHQSSIKKIIKSSFSPIGTLDFTVKFRDGQIKKIPSKSLKNNYSQLIKQFEVINRNKSRNSRAKARTTTSRNNKRISYRKEESEEEDEEEYSEEEESSDFEDEDDIDFLEEQMNSKTSRGRLTVKPKSFQNEFYPDRPEEQISRKPMSVHVPPYTDDLFLEYHSERCLRCYKFGNPEDMSNNDDGKVQIGSQSKRTRLLLCQSCSVSMHNNCISTHKLIDKTTKNLKCPKCVRGTNCSRCDTSILKTKGSKQIPFRCFTCNTAYHYDCIIPGTSSELRDKLKSMDLVDLYRSGQCIECSTFLKDKKPQAVADERKLDGRLEYYIKWKDLSYRHASWVSAKWIANYSTTLHRGYLKRKEKEGSVPLSEDVVCIDRILDVIWTDKSHKEAKKVLAVFKDTEYADAVWDEPPPKDDERLYTDYENALKRYIQASKVLPPKNMKGLIANVRSAATSESYKSRELKAQPDFIKGGTLMKHQLEALNWLIYQWEKRMPCILADDMGLGKTIQVISLLFYLYRKFLIYPFFIVVPNSTATNWVREFAKWAPELIVVPYFGQGAARKLALENEIFDAKGQLKCHVVIATYESACEPSKLHDIFWPVLIVDESQRLKNDESLLFKTLARLRVDHIVLLTGTPLQNRLRELFNIMHFIRPLEFKGDEADHYEEMTKPQIDELHSRLKPYFLRRTKQEVLKKLPPKYELIVPVSMTALQKEVYKLCLSSEIIETLSEATGTKRQKGLSSIFTNLRKTLNHPYLLDGVELEQSTPEEVQQSMIEACGKLKLFHQMLPKILEQGHRILIFSTMTRNLDIIEDYLDYELVKYVRIDGSAKEASRVKAIDAFNAPNSKINVFLLSTRAGGVGINLATADTVIIWDSDFNPYADLQAISRAHRIGQANMVIIYRFMTRLSVEEKILQIGKKKMALEHVVVERMKADEEENVVEDLESILKFGTEALFDNDDSKDIRYDDSAIDNLLNREQYREAATELQIKEVEELEGIDKEQGTMNFSFAKVWQADGTTEELQVDETETPNESDFWDKFLIEQQNQKEKKKQAKREAELKLGRGGRKRTAVSYVESATKLLSAEIGHKLITDEEFILRHDDDSDDDDDHGDPEPDLMNGTRSAKKVKLDENNAPKSKRVKKTKKQAQAALLNGQQQQQQQQIVQPQKEKRRVLTEWEWVISARHQEVMWNSIVLPGILDIITKYRVEHRTTIGVPTARYRGMKSVIVAEIWRLVHEFSKKEMDREYIHEIESGVSQKVATDRFHLKFAFYNQNVNLVLHQVIQGYINFYENEVYFELKTAEIESSIADPILKSEQLNSLKETHKLLQTQLNGIAANATSIFNMAFERIIALRPPTNAPKEVSYSPVHPASNAETSAVNFQSQFKVNTVSQPQVRPLNTASPQYNNNGQQTTFRQQQQQNPVQLSTPIVAQSPAPVAQSPAPVAQSPFNAQTSTKSPPATNLPQGWLNTQQYFIHKS